MNRNSYRMLAFVLVFAMMLGVTMSMMPAAVQAHGMGGHPMYRSAKHMPMDTGSAQFKPNELPEVVERDFKDGCDWWRYELSGGRYVRTYCPCRYGDAEVDYSPNHRSLWAQYVSTGQ